MATDTGFGKVKIFDDFIGHTFDETNNWNIGEENSSSEAITIDDNGYVRLTTGATSGNRSAFGGEVIWEAENGGPLILEVRLKNSSAITDRALFVGFTDVKPSGTLEMPIEMATTVLTTTASDAVGFMYDTDADNDYWYCTGVKVNADGTEVNTSVAPKITDQTLRVVVNGDGDATFWIDGKYVGKVDDAVTASTKLCPIVCIETRATATKVIDIDYVYVEGGRS